MVVAVMMPAPVAMMVVDMMDVAADIDAHFGGLGGHGGAKGQCHGGCKYSRDKLFHFPAPSICFEVVGR
jgi:hypothetical protein